MAIAFDALGSAKQNTGTSLAFTHTVGAGASSSILIFNLAYRASTNPTAQVGTLTYGGVNATKVAYGSASDRKAEQWYLINPPTGATNGTVTFSLNPEASFIVTTSYFGVDQINPVSGSATNTGAAAAGTITLTSTTNNLMVGVMSYYPNGGANVLTSGAANGEVGRGTSTTGDNTIGIGVSDEPGVASGSIVWTSGQSFSWAGVGVSLSPSVKLNQSSGTAVLGLGSTSTVWANNTVAGNLIVVGVNLTNAATLGTVSSITDSQSNTYTRAIRGTINTVGDVLNAEIWYAKNITGGAGSVTVNHTVDNCAMFAREYTGYNRLDVTNAANGSSTAPNTGTVTTNFAQELLVVVTGDDKSSGQTWTAAGKYSNIVGTQTTITGLSMEDQAVTSAGAQTGTLTLGGAANWEALFASFYLAPPVTYKTLLGAGQA